MNATRLCRALSLLLMVIPLVGCSSSSLPTASPGKSLIQISIDWSDLARTNMQDTSVAFTSHEINAVGARLVYPGENASFTQAISKETAKKQGVITFEVPTSDQAHLYLVAVNTDTQTTFSYALTRNLVLEDNSVLPMTIAGFQWVEATWIVEDGYIDAVEKEYFELPDSHNEVMVQIIAQDVNEQEILNLIREQPARIIVTVIGSQGYVFGRGNQQISAEVIKQVGKENISIVATRNKIDTLQGRPLLVDTGDQEVNSLFDGYIRVITSYSSEITTKIKGLA